MGLKLLYYYLLIPLFLAFCFVLGFLFNLLIHRKTEFKLTIFSLFVDLVLGIVIVVSIYSIIITGGRTVSWMYILGLTAYVFFRKQSPTIDTSPVISGKELIKSGLNFFLLSIILYFVYLSSLIDFNTLGFTDTECDWQFYAKVSQYLNLGYESISQFDNIAFNGSFTPYHYFEIWIAAIISRLFFVPSQIAVSIIMPSILGTIAYIGILSFAARLNIKNRILSFLLLFLSSVTFFSSFISKLGITGFFTAGNISSVVYMFKLYSFLIFFILTIQYTHYRNFFLAVISLLFIPVASFVAAPSIIILVWILAGVYFIRYRGNPTFFSFVVFLLIYTILFVCFYIFFWDTASEETFLSFQGIGTYLNSMLNILLLIVNISPFLVILVYLRNGILPDRGEVKPLIIFYSILIIISMCVAIATAGNFNGIQFFTNIFVPSSVALISYFVFNMKISKNLTNVMLYSIMTLLLLSSMYYSVKRIYRERFEKQNIVFMAQVRNFLKPAESEAIYCAFIHSQTFYSNFYANSYSKLFMVGESLDAYRNNFFQVGLSDYTALAFFQNEYNGTKRTRELALVAVPQGTFYKFVKSEKMDGTFISIENSQIKFINQYNIKYIFIQKDTSISNELSEKLKLLTSEEGVSGYSFYEISE